MIEKFVNERIEKYAKEKELYSDFAECIKNILKGIINKDYPNVRVASYASRAKDIESLRKKLSKDKYTEDSEITDLAGVRVITYCYGDLPAVEKVVEKSFDIDKINSVDKASGLGSDKVGYRAIHYIVSLGSDRVKLPEYESYKGLKCEVQLTSITAHAWSEITHERGYKCDGVLPVELEREKNLIAGLYEVADQRMDEYLTHYDEYVRRVEQDVIEGCLKESINAITLFKYMKWKFPLFPTALFRDVKLIIDELNEYGLSTIKELDDIANEQYCQEMQNAVFRSFDGIIRNILVIHDAERYYSKAWESSMKQMNRKNYELYKKYGIDIDEICQKYEIKVV